MSTILDEMPIITCDDCGARLSLCDCTIEFEVTSQPLSDDEIISFDPPDLFSDDVIFDLNPPACYECLGCGELIDKLDECACRDSEDDHYFVSFG